MCGIVGLVGPAATQENLLPMLRTIVHRGPDDWGLHTAAGGAIGMRRLSIIDLTGGHQPMLSPDGRYAIVFNGEIYNYLELAADLKRRGLRLTTNSDTEVIIRLFELEGASCVHHLRGMFAFAIWDGVAQRLFLARDRLGKKPLYYGWVGRTFVFGSELKSFRNLPDVDLALDPIAVAQYFTYRYVPGPRTIFGAFKKLLPGHILLLDSGTLTTQQYWRADFMSKTVLSLDEAEDACAQILDEAVALRLRSDVPVGAFLSGGLDSSVVVAAMARHSSHQVRTFSVGWEGHPSIDELPAARRVARLFSTHHEEVLLKPRIDDLLQQVIWHLDEPLADPAAVPTLVMSRVAAQHVKVVLTGEGGDELFGGYPYLRTLNLLHHLPPRPRPLRHLARDLAERLPRRGVWRPFVRAAELLSGDLSDALRATLSTFGDADRRHLLGTAALERSPAPRGLDLDGLLLELTSTWLPDDLLMKVDKMTMAASLEARAPLLDHELFQFVASLPPSYKIRGGTSKYLLRRVAQRWLPADVVHRPKQGFSVPLRQWLQGELRELVVDALQPCQLARHGLLNPAVVQALLTVDSPTPRQSLQLWTVLCFQLWHDAFIYAA